MERNQIYKHIHTLAVILVIIAGVASFILIFAAANLESVKPLAYIPVLLGSTTISYILIEGFSILVEDATRRLEDKWKTESNNDVNN